MERDKNTSASITSASGDEVLLIWHLKLNAIFYLLNHFKLALQLIYESIAGSTSVASVIVRGHCKTTPNIRTFFRLFKFQQKIFKKYCAVK